MKADFGRREFNGHFEVQEAALQWARGAGEEAPREEVQKLVDHCQAVIDAGGEYITK